MFKKDIAKAHIKNYADSIRKEIKEKGINMLYGEPFDIDDPDSVLVVAVLMAERKTIEKNPFLFN